MTAWLSTFFCVVIRLGVVILFSPIEAIKQLPFMVRLLLTFLISLLLLPSIPTVQIHTNLQLLGASLFECINGLMMLLGMQAALTTFQIAGQLIDNQMGLNAMVIFNPAEAIQESFTGRLFTLFAVYLFFTENYHHTLLLALKLSFTMTQPGQCVVFSRFLDINHIGSLFILSFLMAAPLLTALLCIDISGAVLMRNMPQVNTWFLILPLKILAGIFFLHCTFSHMHPLIHRVFHRMEGLYS